MTIKVSSSSRSVAASRMLQRKKTEAAAMMALAANEDRIRKASLKRAESEEDGGSFDVSSRRLKRSGELASGLAGAAFFAINVDLNKVLVRAETATGDWMERNRFRIKFIVQSCISAYTLGWTIPLIAQSWAQQQLCLATNLCPRFIFPLMVIALVLPGTIVVSLIAFFFVREWLRKALEARSLRPMIMNAMLVVGIVFSLPVILIFGGAVGAPIWAWIFICWTLVWWFKWLDSKIWGVLCLISCVTLFTSNIPIAVLVTILYNDGYDVSVKNEESNIQIFVGNMAGQAFAIGTFAISFFMRQDIWRCFLRLLRADRETPWHFYEEVTSVCGSS